MKCLSGARACAATGAITVAFGAGCGGNQPHGYFNIRALEADIKAQGDSILKKHPGQFGLAPRAHVTDVECVKSEATARTFECRLSFSSTDFHETLVVLVSEDGNTYLPERVTGD